MDLPGHDKPFSIGHLCLCCSGPGTGATTGSQSRWSGRAPMPWEEQNSPGLQQVVAITQQSPRCSSLGSLTSFSPHCWLTLGQSLAFGVSGNGGEGGGSTSQCLLSLSSPACCSVLCKQPALCFPLTPVWIQITAPNSPRRQKPATPQTTPLWSLMFLMVSKEITRVHFSFEI